MDFTTDWLSNSLPGIERTLASFPKVSRILEIGSWEGRSACYFLDKYPDAVITCVDTFQGSPEHVGLDVTGTKQRFLANTSKYGDRVTLREGHSSRELYGLPPESFDLIYVDGSHEEPDVMMDLALAYGLLKPGGVMLVDDYNQPAFPGVKSAVDKFSAACASKLRTVLCEYQIHFIKKPM